MNEVVPVNVTSEIGKLEAVLIHTPEVIIASLASQVREREALIVETLFRHHSLLKAPALGPPPPGEAVGESLWREAIFWWPGRIFS